MSSVHRSTLSVVLQTETALRIQNRFLISHGFNLIFQHFGLINRLSSKIQGKFFFQHKLTSIHPRTISNVVFCPCAQAAFLLFLHGLTLNSIRHSPHRPLGVMSSRCHSDFLRKHQNFGLFKCHFISKSKAECWPLWPLPHGGPSLASVTLKPKFSRFFH